jgi:hypothetical protein
MSGTGTARSRRSWASRRRRGSEASRDRPTTSGTARRSSTSPSTSPRSSAASRTCATSRALSLGLLPEPPSPLEQLHDVRDQRGRRRGPQTAHGTLIRWTEGSGGLRAATATGAGKRRTTRPRLADGAKRRHGSPSRHVNGSSTRSTTANHSGSHSAILA